MVVGICNPSYSGGWGRRIGWTQEAEIGVSQDRAIALHLGWQSKTLSQNKIKSKVLFSQQSIFKFHQWSLKQLSFLASFPLQSRVQSRITWGIQLSCFFLSSLIWDSFPGFLCISWPSHYCLREQTRPGVVAQCTLHLPGSRGWDR